MAKTCRYRGAVARGLELGEDRRHDLEMPDKERESGKAVGEKKFSGHCGAAFRLLAKRRRVRMPPPTSQGARLAEPMGVLFRASGSAAGLELGWALRRDGANPCA